MLYCVTGLGEVYQWRVCTFVLSPELVQQGLGLLEIRRVKPFGEPAVDIPKYLLRFLKLPLALPESSEAVGST